MRFPINGFYNFAEDELNIYIPDCQNMFDEESFLGREFLQGAVLFKIYLKDFIYKNKL